jgi:hypothetical protein
MDMKNDNLPSQPTLRIPPDALARLQMLAQASDDSTQRRESLTSQRSERNGRGREGRISGA